MFLELLFWKNAREAESLRNNYQWKARSLPFRVCHHVKCACNNGAQEACTCVSRWQHYSAPSSSSASRVSDSAPSIAGRCPSWPVCGGAASHGSGVRRRRQRCGRRGVAPQRHLHGGAGAPSSRTKGPLHVIYYGRVSCHPVHMRRIMLGSFAEQAAGERDRPSLTTRGRMLYPLLGVYGVPATHDNAGNCAHDMLWTPQ